MEKKKEPCTVPRECKSCKSAIFWTTTQKGKAMPVDCVPADDGTPKTFILWHRKSADKLFAEVYRPEKHHGRLQYTCHFATCPQADSHRKERR